MVQGSVRAWCARQTNLLLLAAGAFLLGLVAGRFNMMLPLWFAAIVGCGGLLLRNRPLLRALVIMVACFSLGLWRGGSFYASLHPYRAAAYQKVRLTVTATEDATYAAGGQLSFMADTVTFDQPAYGKRPGKVTVKGYGELAVYKGDRVEVSAKLYPTRGSALGSLSYATVHRVGSHSTYIDAFRRRFGAGLQTALPEPAAPFGMGLLIGQRSTLPDDIAQSLKMVGLTHIIAVSGYNLTILLTAARRLMGKRSKRASTIVALALMLGFIGLTGASASIVRAAVVSGLSLAAWYVGREVRPMVLLLLAAALTAGVSPLYVWSDIGWYLSFLAFFGILMLAPQLYRRIWGEKTPPVLAGIAIETLCAEIMTIPLIMFIFGQVSLVGLLANVLVASFIPLAMLLCFVAGMAGWLLPLLAGWFSWPATMVLTYMLDIAGLLAKIPHGFQTNTYLSVFDMTLCYAGLALLVAALYKPRYIRWYTHSREQRKRSRNAIAT